MKMGTKTFLLVCHFSTDCFNADMVVTKKSFKMEALRYSVILVVKVSTFWQNTIIDALFHLNQSNKWEEEKA